jgi:hypothetical protein
MLELFFEEPLEFSEEEPPDFFFEESFEFLEEEPLDCFFEELFEFSEEDSLECLLSLDLVFIIFLFKELINNYAAKV